MASEMLELQAARGSRPGIAFGNDTDWQREFDASFPYEETPDQLAAIKSIKDDMHRPRPMDRLLCGDVGFGKTEVAMRAAFKAVDNGYQVAILVPTTILCEQHYQSLRARLAEFPFDIGKLSRFCTPQEMRETSVGLKAGRIDIVVGTHRVASQDVEFHNLGLVVIDEAGQCTEASMWQAVLRADRVVLAGDHFQLPPTVLSAVAAREGLRESLMQRLVDAGEFAPMNRGEARRQLRRAALWVRRAHRSASCLSARRSRADGTRPARRSAWWRG